MQLPSLTSSPALARQRMTDFLTGRWRTESAGPATLIVSELVTNAVIHGGAPIRLHVDIDAALRIEVSDGGRCSGPLIARPVEGDGPGGRGLRIVEAIADDWGTRLDDHGKTVWAELHEALPADRRPTAQAAGPRLTSRDFESPRPGR